MFVVFKQVLICIQDEVQIIVQLVVITTFAQHMPDQLRILKCQLIEASIRSIKSQDSSF